KIGLYAFYGCSGLTAIEMPNSGISIDSYAFHGCDGLAATKK
ncbi:MAG: leucine-rich repeat protein, partial [Bacteroidales bacterium]|nr:leucine-rich repeat protein [Bacteroidales bacterium]